MCFSVSKVSMIRVWLISLAPSIMISESAFCWEGGENEAILLYTLDLGLPLHFIQQGFPNQVIRFLINTCSTNKSVNMKLIHFKEKCCG